MPSLPVTLWLWTNASTVHGRPPGEDVAVGCVAFALLALSNGNVQEETVIPTQQSTTP